MIPIYRAKKKESDEFIIGYLIRYSNGYHIKLLHESTEVKIDASTIAMHFPDMIDKNGKKIFASLSKSGVGGDYSKDDMGLLTFVSRYENNGFRFCHGGVEVLGIYTGVE